MREVVDRYEPIICVGGPGHGKSFTGYRHPELKLPYTPPIPWQKIWRDGHVGAQDYFALTYERFLVEVTLPGLRLNGYVWKWDQLNDEDCVKSAMGLVLASTILTHEKSYA